MDTFKKSTYFTKVEDRYVFKVSTAFWHLLIGLITLAAIAGIVVLLWSIIPPFKKTVNTLPYPSKPVFPAEEKVSLADLHLDDESPKSKILLQPLDTTALIIQPPKPAITEVAEYDPDKPSYDSALAQLKNLMPDDQWKPGQWVITNQLGWDLYHSDKYRQWIASGSSIEDNLDRIYKALKAKKYAGKKRALVSITNIVKSFPHDINGQPVQYISKYANSNWQDLRMFDSLCTLISTNISVFRQKPSEPVEQMVKFGFNEQYVAFDFIPFAIRTVSQFADSLKASVFSTLYYSYYNNFDRNFEVQKEATQQFNDLIPQLQRHDPALVLRKLYMVYNQKNKQRSDEIARLLANYQEQINYIKIDSTNKAYQAQIEYLQKQAKKKELRWKSMQAIGAGFIAIALLGTILTLLSIQRILKRMEGYAEKGNVS